MLTVELEIAPNEKYRAVVRGDVDDESIETETDYREAHPAPDVADEYVKTIESAPTAEEMGMTREEMGVLSWNDISPSSDPDLLGTIATYFTDIDPAEPAEKIRAKCRLLDVEVYANAQIAANAELRST